MEAKVKHRIIGIVIISAALIAIALPLLFSDNEVINTAKVQPLPDQASISAVQALQNESQSTSTPMVSVQPVPQQSASTQPAIVASTQPLVQPEIKTQNVQAQTQQLPKPAAVQTAVAAPVKTPSPQVSPVIVKKVATVTTSSVKAKASKPLIKLVKPMVAKAHSKTAAHPKQVAWVVQMGSFKNKENARHLTDQLRAAGFKAFTYASKSGLHGSVRVYVGPEYKQARVSALSNKLARKTKIQGIILPYQPLVLDDRA